MPVHAADENGYGQKPLPPSEAGPSSQKWANWKASVNVVRGKLHAEVSSRTSRLENLQKMQPTALNLEDREKVNVRNSFERYGRWTTDNFEPLKVLGEGAFGTVYLVQRKDTKEFYALKQMEKKRYELKNRQRAYFERDGLAQTQSNWCVQLFATFQDSDHVYMVMEFIQGGDLVGLLIRYGQLSIEHTRFYMAELLEAIDVVHKCGLVHRDIKPDNAVITKAGHLKLLDFGLCKVHVPSVKTEVSLALAPATFEEHAGRPFQQFVKGNGTRARLNSIVGTPQYMAPESFAGRAGPEADIWALGVIMFECLAGVVPFHAGRKEGPEAIQLIRDRASDHARIFPERMKKIGDGMLVPGLAVLLMGIVCTMERRLTAEQIRFQTFFETVDFTTLNQQTPPFIPKVESASDTSMFDAVAPAKPLPPVEPRMCWDQGIDWADFAVDSRPMHRENL